MIKKLILYIFFLNLTFSLNATEVNELEKRIYKNIRCLVCQGQSIADSNTEFSQTIKLVVKDQINQSKTEKEIYDFLVEKYGEWILYDPLFNKNNFLLWFLPYFVLVAGGLIIFFALKKKKEKLD